jgi:hypothetical protein
MRSNNGYSRRYPKNWRSITKAILSTYPNCSFPGCNNLSRCVHHSSYEKFNKYKAGVNLFPLCHFHHTGHKGNRRSPDCAHHPKNWNPGTLPPPTLDACNTPTYYQKLLSGFRQKYCHPPKIRDIVLKH